MALLTLHHDLLGARRWRIPAPARAISAAETGALLAVGALATLVTAYLPLSLSIPGHAILRGLLPMAAGLALVPRRGAGSIMAVGAAICAGVLLSAGGVGINPLALIGTVALGPLLDVALGWSARRGGIYLRFVAAGVTANLLVFGVRFVSARLGLEPPSSHHLATFWPMGLVSFVACGALAGALSAAACFRLTRSE